MEWYYRRSGMLMRSPVKLHASWHEAGREEYPEPNCVAEAARSLGVEDDRAWIALSHAELLEGKKICRLGNRGARSCADATGLDQTKLLERAKSPEIDARIRATTAEFHAMQVTQRPTFVIDTPIGDRAVFSGFAKAAPLAATIDAMLDDIVGYRGARRTFRRAASLIRAERNALRLFRCRIQLPLGSGPAANRSTRSLASAEISRVRRAPAGSDGRLRATRMTASVSLPVAGPEIIKFCNNKFV